jgi:hypothetical protein
MARFSELADLDASSSLLWDVLGAAAWPDGKHSGDGSSPLDHGRKKRWGKDRPVNHGSGNLAATHWFVVV